MSTVLLSEASPYNLQEASKWHHKLNGWYLVSHINKQVVIQWHFPGYCISSSSKLVSVSGHFNPKQKKGLFYERRELSLLLSVDWAITNLHNEIIKEVKLITAQLI